MQALLDSVESGARTRRIPPCFVGILGEPGAGKSTPANVIRQMLIPLEEMGCRIERARLGYQAQLQKSSGGMVDDQPVIQLFREDLARLSPGCRVFSRDGYPRSLGQAQDLYKQVEEGLIQKPLIIGVLLDDEKLARERMSGRRNCSRCGKLYHLRYAPSAHPTNPHSCGGLKDGKLCGGTLLQRQDSTDEAIDNRLRTFREVTRPAIEFCQQKGWLYRIDGKLSVQNVAAETRRILAMNLSVEG